MKAAVQYLTIARRINLYTERTYALTCSGVISGGHQPPAGDVALQPGRRAEHVVEAAADPAEGATRRLTAARRQLQLSTDGADGRRRDGDDGDGGGTKSER